MRYEDQETDAREAAEIMRRYNPMTTELDAMLEERRTRYAASRREFASYTLDALWTLRDRMERNGSDAGPRYQALTDTLSSRFHFIPFTK